MIGQTLETVTVTGTVRGSDYSPNTPFNPLNSFGGTISNIIWEPLFVPNYQEYVQTNLFHSNSILGSVDLYGQYNTTANYGGFSTLITGYDVSGNVISQGTSVGNPFIGGSLFLDYGTNTQTSGIGLGVNLAYLGVGFKLSPEGITTNFNVTMPNDMAQQYGVDVTYNWNSIAIAAAILLSDGLLIPVLMP